MPASKATKAERNKKVALSFFELIAPPDGPMAALKIFGPRCRHHNPYSPPGMKALLKEMARVQQDAGDADMPTDPVFEIKQVMADDDMVMVYTTMRSRSQRSKGFRQVHLFRFKGDKVVEYWDVTQLAPSEAKWAANMF
jgi:predicted SnoaL-like aldol condensation-catalyzing enzyme